MEIITTSIAHLPEIISTVIFVLGGQKGFEFYKKKRYLNGGHNRRSNSSNNSFSTSDKEFIKSCFTDHSKESALTMKNSRLELVVELGQIIRDEGDRTRVAVRTN